MTPLPMIHDQPRSGSAVDPVCGMTVDPLRAAGSYAHEGQTYYFCNVSCLNRFKADPARYLHPTTNRSHTDPVCGMDVKPDQAAGTAEHEGHTYYFCSGHCVTTFRSDPKKYVNRPAPVSQRMADAGTDAT